MYTTGSGDETTAKHYGTLYTMSDYTSKSQTLYLGGSVQATDKLRVHGTAVMNMATAEYDPVEMPAVTEEVTIELSHMDYNFENLHSYSALDYELLQVSLQADYRLASDLTFTLGGDYADLKDNAGYVYGDESGQYFMIRSGVKIDF